MGKRGNCSSAPPARGLLADGNAAAAGLLYPLPAAWKEPSKGFFFFWETGCNYLGRVRIISYPPLQSCSEVSIPNIYHPATFLVVNSSGNLPCNLWRANLV